MTKCRLGDRVSLGQAMTLVESNHPADRKKAVELLEQCETLPGSRRSFRLAVSGSPGVGKSTLLNALGKKAIQESHKIGILTVDPTSTLSKGSILGDKSRMQAIANDPSAFIRSSPAGDLLGGIHRRSFELMTLLEAVGYDIIFLETVGVGQSEHVAWHLTDGFILVLQPAGGDELQGMKRGITELADIILINKADGNLKKEAALTKSHFQNALNYLHSNRKAWEPKVLTCSALENTGIDDFWEVLRLFMDSRLEDGRLEAERLQQIHYWLNWSAEYTARFLFMNHPDVNQKLSEGFHNISLRKKSIFRTEFDIEMTMKELIHQS
jgi:LAO/AO transport system kinase